MINELYEALIKRVTEHGITIHGAPMDGTTIIDKDHAVVSFMYGPERCFVFLGNKSFLIRMWNEDDKTRNNR